MTDGRIDGAGCLRAVGCTRIDPAHQVFSKKSEGVMLE